MSKGLRPSVDAGQVAWERFGSHHKRLFRAPSQAIVSGRNPLRNVQIFTFVKSDSRVTNTGLHGTVTDITRNSSRLSVGLQTNQPPLNPTQSSILFESHYNHSEVVN
jgi:hypothetical protein